MLGKHHSEETKRKIGLASKGRYHLSKIAFKKGHIPWNKDKKTGFIPKTAYKRGEHPSPKTEFKKGQISPKKGNKYPQYSRENSGAWKGGVVIKHGYFYVLFSTHPFCDKAGYVKKARLVMEKHLGRYLNREEIVHHINEIKNDDRIENLKLFPNKSKHTSFHLFKRHDVAK